MRLNQAVNEGESFASSEELYEVCMKFPLNFTEYHLLEMNRQELNWDNIPKAIERMKIGRTHYLIRNIGGKIVGFHHSRHSKGEELPQLLLKPGDDKSGKLLQY